MEEPQAFFLHVAGQSFQSVESYLQASNNKQLISNPSWSDHPEWATENGDSIELGRLQRELISLLRNHPPYIQSITVPTTDELGLGWIISAVLLGPPEPNDYAGRSYKISIHMPARYPALVPTVEFDNIMYHIQINERSGQLDPIFYDHVNWSASSSVLDIIKLVYQMLECPLRGPDPSDHDIKHHWHHEHPEMLALSADELERAIAEEKERKHLQWLVKAGEISSYMAERTKACKSYKPVISALYFSSPADRIPKDWLDERFSSALSVGTQAALKGIMVEECPGVYSFPLLSTSICDSIQFEVANYEASPFPRRRPNSMNKYGLVLDDVGMEHTMSAFMRDLISPVAKMLYSAFGGSSLDRQHAFVVQYRSGEDLKLDMHTDDSEVTLNVCLGRQFEGSGLTFCGKIGDKNFLKLSHSYQHQIGRAVIHLGRHRHGADLIRSGERYNLIVWCTSNKYRGSPAYRNMSRIPGEDPPDQQCLKPSGRV